MLREIGNRYKGQTDKGKRRVFFVLKNQSKNMHTYIYACVQTMSIPEASNVRGSLLDKARVVGQRPRRAAAAAPAVTAAAGRSRRPPLTSTAAVVYPRHRRRKSCDIRRRRRRAEVELGVEGGEVLEVAEAGRP